MSTKKKTAKAPATLEAKAPATLEAKAPAKSVERKIEQGELIQLQKEGRLTSYDSATGLGTVLLKGKAVNWPGDGTQGV